MPSLNITVDDDRAMARLERVGPAAREALEEQLGDLAEQIASDAQSRAAAHIRFFGAKNPGSYVASIEGGVSVKDKRVAGYVRSGHPLAHLMELGVKAHDIFPKNAEALMFEGSVGAVFAKHVHDPGMQPYPALVPAFEAARGEIEAALQAAVAETAAAD